MKEPSSELYKWLKNQEAEGTRDSSGSFTLEHGKAWEKLGAFQLPFEEAWVLKVVQATRAHSTAKLKIQQTREETTFVISGVGDWTRTTLEKAVFSLGENAPRPLAHLAVGVRALAQKKTRPFALRYPNGEHLAWTGKSFAALPDEKGDGSSLVLTTANFEFGQSRSLFSLDNSDAQALRAEILAVITQFCHLSDQYIFFDGVKLDSHLTDPHFGVSENSCPLALIKCEPDEDLPSVGFAERKDWSPRQIGTHSVELEFESSQPLIPTDGCAALGLLAAFVRKKRLREDVSYYESTRDFSEVVWVGDGVVVKRERFPWKSSVGLGLVLSADGIPTDLTGLVPRDEDELARRRERGLSLILKRLRILQSANPEGVDISYSNASHLIQGAIGLVLMFCLTPVGLAMMGNASYKYTSAKRRAQELDLKIDRGLRELISKIEAI